MNGPYFVYMSPHPARFSALLPRRVAIPPRTLVVALPLVCLSLGLENPKPHQLRVCGSGKCLTFRVPHVGKTWKYSVLISHRQLADFQPILRMQPPSARRGKYSLEPAILQVFEGQPGQHFTVEEVHQQLSQGTHASVYAWLRHLDSTGQLQSTQIPGQRGKRRYWIEEVKT